MQFFTNISKPRRLLPLPLNDLVVEFAALWRWMLCCSSRLGSAIPCGMNFLVWCLQWSILSWLCPLLCHHASWMSAVCESLWNCVIELRQCLAAGTVLFHWLLTKLRLAQGIAAALVIFGCCMKTQELYLSICCWPWTWPMAGCCMKAFGIASFHLSLAKLRLERRA